jgi:murein DD-endopeptidase MepM/ murein hydrolase activator NlpD
MGIRVSIRGLSRRPLGAGAVHPDPAAADTAERAPLFRHGDPGAVPDRVPPMPIPAAMAAAARGVTSQTGAGFAVFRPKQGPHGTWHWGLDVPFDRVTHGAVRAPETLTVVNTWTDNKTAPFVGYGPQGLVGRGGSGLFHLLGHLASLSVKVGDVVESGDIVGLDDEAVGHVHWEVRTIAVDEGPATRAAFTINPVLWLDGARAVVLSRSPGVPWWVWALGLYAVTR